MQTRSPAGASAPDERGDTDIEPGGNGTSVDDGRQQHTPVGAGSAGQEDLEAVDGREIAHCRLPKDTRQRQLPTTSRKPPMALSRNRLFHHLFYDVCPLLHWGSTPKRWPMPFSNTSLHKESFGLRVIKPVTDSLEPLIKRRQLRKSLPLVKHSLNEMLVGVTPVILALCPAGHRGRRPTP